MFEGVGRRGWAAGLALCAGLAIASQAGAATLTPIPSYVDPGGGVTSVLGINNAGWMTGSVTEPGGAVHGFIRDAGGTYTLFDVGPQTFGRAIDNTNRVSGYATDNTGNLNTDQEFTRAAGGAVTILQNPGTATDLHGIAQGMDAAGDVVGDYLVGASQRDGFILNGASFTDLSQPGMNVRARAITDAGVVAGWVTPTGGASRGFVFSGGVFSFFDAPGAVGGTFFEDLNNNGLAAGEYQDAGGAFHAFVFNTLTTDFTNIDVPGATNVEAFGLNDLGQVVLTTDLTGGPNNFIWSQGVPEPATWAMLLTGFAGLGGMLRRRRLAAA